MYRYPIGDYIKYHVIPGGLTVKDAAKRLHVSRTALSRLLNGHASLSVRMALKLEITFAVSAKSLLDRQYGSDLHEVRGITLAEATNMIAEHLGASAYLRCSKSADLCIFSLRLPYGDECLAVDFALPEIENEAAIFDNLKRRLLKAIRQITDERNKLA